MNSPPMRLLIPCVAWILAIVALPLPAQATTLHVPSQYSNIQTGINAATPGDTVLVECGTYLEHDINMGDGVILLSETGEPECVTIDADSLGQVIRCLNLTAPNTAIEGFTLTGGHDNWWGGGVNCEYSVLRVSNCVLTENYVFDVGTPARGGGMSIVGGDVEVLDCTVSYNSADGNGGGIYCSGDSATVLTITDCTFLENTTGNIGGGLILAPLRSENVTVSGCTFDGNEAKGIGGGGASCGGDGTAPVFSNCLFIRNTADSASGQGGGFTSRVYATPTLSSCTFRQNYAYHGGGLCAEASDATLIDCDFEGNDAFMGGGLYSTESVPDVSGGTFYDNSASSSGAGIYATLGDIVVTNVTFDSNHSGGGAGAFCLDSSPQFTTCTFLDNRCSGTGAGFYADNSSPTFTECLFSGNTSSFFAGAMAYYGGSAGTVTNCTLYGNEAPSGGAFVARAGSQASVENTIVAFSTGGTVTYCTDSSSVGLVCSDVYGNQNGDWVGCFAGQSGVNGNFSLDPLFCEPDSLDFTLAASSPCLSALGCGLVGAFGEGCGTGSGLVDQAVSGQDAFGFLGSWPNPVSSTAQLSFTLEKPGRAKLEVYDTGGRRVAVLADRRFEAGISGVTWDGRDAWGQRVSAGVYFCRLEAGDRVDTQKVVLVMR